MKRVILLFSFFLSLFCFPVSIFSQNINGNNNTVIIQMQGNNNSVQNSSINNNSNNSTYRSNSNYNSESASSLFARYKQKNNRLFSESPTWQIEFYNDGTYRYIRGGTIRYGTYTAMSNNKQNNTYTCIERLDNMVDQNGNRMNPGEMHFKMEAINGVIMENRIRLELVY